MSGIARALAAAGLVLGVLGAVGLTWATHITIWGTKTYDGVFANESVRRKAKAATYGGGFCLAAGFALQLIALWL